MDTHSQLEIYLFFFSSILENVCTCRNHFGGLNAPAENLHPRAVLFF